MSSRSWGDEPGSGARSAVAAGVSMSVLQCVHMVLCQGAELSLWCARPPPGWSQSATAVSAGLTSASSSFLWSLSLLRYDEALSLKQDDAPAPSFAAVPRQSCWLKVSQNYRNENLLIFRHSSDFARRGRCKVYLVSINLYTVCAKLIVRWCWAIFRQIEAQSSLHESSSLYQKNYWQISLQLPAGRIKTNQTKFARRNCQILLQN